MSDNHLIVFLLPGNIDKDDFIQYEKPVPWVYLGKNFQEKTRIESWLGESFRCLDIARLHNEVADSIRNDFIKWIDRLNEQNGSFQDWWFGPVSSRNVYRSDVFQFCCYTEIMKMLWADNTRRPVFIVVESPAFVEILEEWCRSQNIEFTFKNRLIPYLTKICIFGKFLLRWANYIISLGLKKSASLILREHTRKRVREIKDPLIIHTYLHPGSISETGIFKDRYFPFLHEYLEKNGKSIVVLTTYQGYRYLFFPLFSRMKKSQTFFLVPECLYTLKDCFVAAGYPIQLLFKSKNFPPFRSIDYSRILKEDTLKDRFEESLDAILLCRGLRNLKYRGIYPARIIDWYENQAINRALCLAVRKEFPGIPILGVQLFLHYPNFLSLAPSSSEILNRIVPDKLLVTSSYQCRQATRFSTPPGLPCEPCAALRYSHVFSDTDNPSRSTLKSEKTILLLTSFDINETLELLFQVRDISAIECHNIRIMVKLHPDIQKEEILRYLRTGKNSDRFQFFPGMLSEALDDATLVISKSSGSIVEAATRGIPVIFLGNQTKLNLNPLAGIDLPNICECYTTEDLDRAIGKFLSCTAEEIQLFQKNGVWLRDIFFTRIQEDTLRPFIE